MYVSPWFTGWNDVTSFFLNVYNTRIERAFLHSFETRNFDRSQFKYNAECNFIVSKFTECMETECESLFYYLLRRIWNVSFFILDGFRIRYWVYEMYLWSIVEPEWI